MNLLIINGPNLNLLGRREQEVYGYQTFEAYLEELRAEFKKISIEYFQSNIEGELIDRIQDAGFKMDGIIINPGGYSHTSVAIADAIRAVPAKVTEVHISQVFNREEFRKTLITASAAGGFICGFGLEGYRMAILNFLVDCR
ncbi:MAG: type II 3-dehydroquinate dehydratase [Bacteroidales bacterium]